MNEEDLRTRLHDMAPAPDEINPAAIDPHAIERRGRRRRRRTVAGIGVAVAVVAAAIAVPLATTDTSAPARVSVIASPSAITVPSVGPTVRSGLPKGKATATTPLPPDTALQDLTWVSATEGWALAAKPCTAGTCTRLAHTDDGGARWEQLPDPPAQLQDGTVDCSTHACVSNVRFASADVGYLYGPALLMTTDAGRTWQVEPGLSVETLTVAGGRVYRVAFDHSGCPGPCDPTLQDAAIGSGVWHTLIQPLAQPGQSGNAQIVASGAALLLASYGNPAAGVGSAQAVLYRSDDGGVSWQREDDPCGRSDTAGTAQEEDLRSLAAASGRFFAGLCNPRFVNGSSVNGSLVTSADGGASWQVAGPLPNVANGLVAAASPTRLAVATGPVGGIGAFTAHLFVSTDAGKHWTSAATDNLQLAWRQMPAWLAFQTTRDGAWLSGSHTIWTTHDGGQQWTQTAFP